MRFICYLRVSTDEQAESGAGLAAQTDACRRHTERARGEFVGPFADDDEGVSSTASLDKRPHLLAAIAELTRGDILLVAKRDRLGRDPILVAMIEAAVRRRGAKIVSAAGEGTDGDSPTDILMRRIVDAFAEYEKLLIGARTKAALQAKIKRGQRVGTVRFGYGLAPGDEKMLVEDPAEQATITLIRELRTSGASLREIADHLNRKGIATKEGRSGWKHTAVQRILSRTT